MHEWNGVLDSRWYPTVIAFVTGLLSRKVPIELYDLHPEHPERLSIPSSLRVSEIISDGSIFYFLDVPAAANPPPWRLVVREAATAVQTFRWLSCADSIHDIARYFFERGIPFSTRAVTAIRTENSNLGADSNEPESLGLRSQYHIFSGADYIAYEEKRNALLRSPKGRAAFLRGGIVWRLAMEVSQSPIDVLSGPSDSALQSGHSFTDTNCTYWDDHLTVKELDLICGVYQVYTGMSPPPITKERR